MQKNLKIYRNSVIFPALRKFFYLQEKKKSNYHSSFPISAKTTTKIKKRLLEITRIVGEKKKLRIFIFAAEIPLRE